MNPIINVGMTDQTVSFSWKTMILKTALGALLFSGAMFLAGCKTGAATAHAQPPPPVVEISEVKEQDAAIYSEFPAQTYARDLVEVRGRVDGYIEKWLFKPGQYVAAGQPLYVLDQRPYRAQVQQAEGTVRQAEGDLKFAQQQVSLQQAEANLESAKANLVKAKQDYDRLKPLVEQNAAAAQDLDSATAALRAADATVRANEANVATVKVNTSTQIQTAEGKVQTQRGALATATLNVEYGTITAPISGVAGDTLVPVGGLVNANSQQPLTSIVPLDPLWVRFKVSEAQYMQYQRQRKSSPQAEPVLELFLADDTKFPHPGHIENSLNQVDNKTGTLEIQARFPNPERVILPGQFGRVRFVSEHRSNVLMIPQRAVLQNQSIQSVYTLDKDNKIEMRAVTTGQRIGDEWIIEQGLKPGDRVVVEGLLSVRPGAVVQPRPYRGASVISQDPEKGQ